MSISDSSEQNEDLISDVMRVLPDKILSLLPIRDAARTSVLSKQWRSNWLSLKCLVFDDGFFRYFYYDDENCDWQECSNIISNILLSHDGSVDEFTLCFPKEADEKCIYFGQWLSFLSKSQVKRIKINNNNVIHRMPITSNIFWCSELIHLNLLNLILHPPPSGFTGFPKLQHLRLIHITFFQEDIFPTFMTTSRKLATLTLRWCNGISNIVIEGPTLETVDIESDLDSIAFRNVCNLKTISVHMSNIDRKRTRTNRIDSFTNLASSRQLQCIEFGYGFCEFLAAASMEKRRVTATFNHLNKLTLHSLELFSFDVLQNIVDMVQSCPYMEKLVIHILTKNNATDQKLDCSRFNKLDHLLEVEIWGISGANMEIQLIKFLLKIAVALETLLYNCMRDKETQLKLSKALLKMPRASQKARVVSWPDF